MKRNSWENNEKFADRCAAIQLLASLQIDNSASPDEKKRIAIHIQSCEACRASLVWMQLTHRAIAERPVVLPPANLKARIAEAIAASDSSCIKTVGYGRSLTFTVRPALALAASLALAAIWIAHNAETPRSTAHTNIQTTVHVASGVIESRPRAVTNGRVIRRSLAVPRSEFIAFLPPNVGLIKGDEYQSAPSVPTTVGLSDQDHVKSQTNSQKRIVLGHTLSAKGHLLVISKKMAVPQPLITQSVLTIHRIEQSVPVKITAPDRIAVLPKTTLSSPPSIVNSIESPTPRIPEQASTKVVTSQPERIAEASDLLGSVKLSALKMNLQSPARRVFRDSRERVHTATYISANYTGNFVQAPLAYTPTNEPSSQQ